MSREKLKAIVRYLPHDMTEEQFLNVVVADRYSRDVYWTSFIQGKAATGNLTNYRHGYAMLGFRSVGALRNFASDNDGKIFTDREGYESRAYVEFAPVQRVPQPPRVNPNTSANTLDTDPDFLKFTEALSSPPTPPINVVQWLEAKLKEKDTKKNEVSELVKDVMHYWYDDRSAAAVRRRREQQQQFAAKDEKRKRDRRNRKRRERREKAERGGEQNNKSQKEKKKKEVESSPPVKTVTAPSMHSTGGGGGGDNSSKSTISSTPKMTVLARPKPVPPAEGGEGGSSFTVSNAKTGGSQYRSVAKHADPNGPS